MIEARVIHKVLSNGGLLSICGSREDFEADGVADLLLRIMVGKARNGTRDVTKVGNVT
jgi:hypothetical protein